MRAYTSFPVDDDIVDRILTLLPDFASLTAAILICKTVHAVFRRHPKSIRHQIALNVLGPVLPIALSVIRASDPVEPHNKKGSIDSSDQHGESESDVGSDSDVSNDSDADEHDDDYDSDDDHNTHVVRSLPNEADSNNAPVDAQEYVRLDRMAYIASSFEDLFSQRFVNHARHIYMPNLIRVSDSLRYKDRASYASQLTPTESARFRRGLFHVWAFTTAFSTSRVGGYSGDTPLLQCMVAFLDPLDTPTLLEVWEVYFFLEGVIRWTMTATEPATGVGQVRRRDCLSPFAGYFHSAWAPGVYGIRRAPRARLYLAVLPSSNTPSLYREQPLPKSGLRAPGHDARGRAGSLARTDRGHRHIGRCAGRGRRV